MKIEGRVTVKPGSFYKSIYIQDSTAGVNIYGVDLSGLNLQYGDYVKVIGDATTYYSDIEVKISSAEKTVKTMSGTPVTPQDITIQQANSTNYGKLVRISGTVKSIDPNGKYFYVQDSGGNAVKVYLRNSSIDISSLNVGDNVQVTGVQSQHYSTYEILPREQGDIVVNPIPEFSGYIWIPMILLITVVIYLLKRQH